MCVALTFHKDAILFLIFERLNIEKLSKKIIMLRKMSFIFREFHFDKITVRCFHITMH